jgi:hypothetical protein
MKTRLLVIALGAACAAAFAQPQSGSNIGPRSAPLPVPSTGTSTDAAGTRGTSPRTAGETSVSSPTLETTGRSSGRCDTLTGEERAQCLREQASTGTTGPASTGAGPGATR